MQEQSILHTLRRYTSLSTHQIRVLPIVILMPHSACNCRCVMCDIWKGNKNVQQLTENDIQELLISLKSLETKRIVMSGGEALLNKNFFIFCELIKKHNVKITLLSTGVTIEQFADKIIELVDEVIVSLDGDEELHNQIRNVPNAFQKMKSGIIKLKSINNSYPISGRSVIHNLNFRNWGKIIEAAKYLKLDSISFLPADVSSQAFNRNEPWDKSKQDNLLIDKIDLLALKEVIEKLISDFRKEFENKFIVESPEKLRKIHQYYSAQQDLSSYPKKNCNAPWVSAVVEADGKVRPCFFHDVIGDIRKESLKEILNNDASKKFRKELNIQTNSICSKCVCYLNLTPRNKFY